MVDADEPAAGAAAIAALPVGDVADDLRDAAREAARVTLGVAVLASATGHSVASTAFAPACWAMAPRPSTSAPWCSVLLSPRAVSQAESVSSSTFLKLSLVSICESVIWLPSPSSRNESSMLPGVNWK